MTNKIKKVIAAISGGLINLLPVFGQAIVLVPILLKKKYNYAILPASCILCFALAYHFDHTSLRSDIQTELNEQIENVLANIPFSLEKQLSDTEFTSLLKKELNSIIEFPLTEDLNKKFDLFAEKAYHFYLEEYEKQQRKTDDSFPIVLNKDTEIKEVCNNFTYWYIDNKYPNPTPFFIFMLGFFVTFISAIISSIRFFYKYTGNENIEPVETKKTIPIPPINEPKKELTLKRNFVVSTGKAEPRYEPERPEEPEKEEEEKIKINEINEEELIRLLNVNSIQAKDIIRKREETGPYKDYNDFINRASLVDRVYRHFKEQLDFTDHRS